MNYDSKGFKQFFTKSTVVLVSIFLKSGFVQNLTSITKDTSPHVKNYANVRKIINAFETMGYVTSSKNSSRQRIIKLTPTGEKLARRLLGCINILDLS